MVALFAFFAGFALDAPSLYFLIGFLCLLYDCKGRESKGKESPYQE